MWEVACCVVSSNCVRVLSMRMQRSLCEHWDMDAVDIPGFDIERCTCIPRKESKGLTCGIANGNNYLIPCERWIESEELCKIAESVSKRFEMKKGNRIRYVVGIGMYIGKLRNIVCHTVLPGKRLHIGFGKRRIVKMEQGRFAIIRSWRSFYRITCFDWSESLWCAPTSFSQMGINPSIGFRYAQCAWMSNKRWAKFTPEQKSEKAARKPHLIIGTR